MNEEIVNQLIEEAISNYIFALADIELTREQSIIINQYKLLGELAKTSLRT